MAVGELDGWFDSSMVSLFWASTLWAGREKEPSAEAELDVKVGLAIGEWPLKLRRLAASCKRKRQQEQSAGDRSAEFSGSKQDR